MADSAAAAAMELPRDLQTYLAKLVGVCVVSYAAVALLIPVVSKWLPAKLSGKDLCKRGTLAGDIPMCVCLFPPLSMALSVSMTHTCCLVRVLGGVVGLLLLQPRSAGNRVRARVRGVADRDGVHSRRGRRHQGVLIPIIR